MIEFWEKFYISSNSFDILNPFPNHFYTEVKKQSIILYEIVQRIIALVQHTALVKKLRYKQTEIFTYTSNPSDFIKFIFLLQPMQNIF